MNGRASDLLIDVGSTAIKWRAGGEKTVRSAAFPMPFDADPPHFEIAPEGILRIVAEAIAEARPARVFLSVQMHGYVLLKEGVPVTGYVSWRDERGAACTPEFVLTPEYGVSLKPNLPRLSVQAQRAEADEFCTLGSYLAKELAGCNATHITDAAASGYFNVTRGTADAAPFRLPRALSSVGPIGKFRKSVVYTPVGDMQAAILGGTEGRDPGRHYLVNIGTAGQMCALSEAFLTGDFESRPFFFGETLCTVTRLPGGAYLRAETAGAEDVLVTAFRAAAERLPRREGALLMGGGALHYRALLEKVFRRLCIGCSFCAGGEALRGLEILSEVT